MSEIPPFPNSVQALPENSKILLRKVEIDRMRSLETTEQNQIVTTHYDKLIYTYRNGEMSTTIPKATGQHIMVSV